MNAGGYIDSSASRIRAISGGVASLQNFLPITKESQPQAIKKSDSVAQVWPWNIEKSAKYSGVVAAEKCVAAIGKG